MIRNVPNPGRTKLFQWPVSMDLGFSEQTLRRRRRAHKAGRASLETHLNLFFFIIFVTQIRLVENFIPNFSLFLLKLFLKVLTKARLNVFTNISKLTEFKLVSASLFIIASLIFALTVLEAHS